MNTKPSSRSPLIQPLVVSVPAAAAALAVGRTTIYQLFGRGELPFVRIAGRTMVPVSALHEFVGRTAGELRPKRGSNASHTKAAKRTLEGSRSR